VYKFRSNFDLDPFGPFMRLHPFVDLNSSFFGNTAVTALKFSGKGLESHPLLEVAINRMFSGVIETKGSGCWCSLRLANALKSHYLQMVSAESLVILRSSSIRNSLYPNAFSANVFGSVDFRILRPFSVRTSRHASSCESSSLPDWSLVPVTRMSMFVFAGRRNSVQLCRALYARVTRKTGVASRLRH